MSRRTPIPLGLGVCQNIEDIMPKYEYECAKCGLIIDEVRVVSKRNDKGKCSKCEGTTSRVYVTPPNFQAFEGSDKLRSMVDKHADFVESAQREGIRSYTEIEEGTAQAHERAKKLGIPVEKILGYKGKKPKLTKESKENFAKQARAQYNIKKS